MRRPKVLLITGVVFVVFLLISALLARIFSADSAQRAAIIAVLQDQAQGDTNAVISRIQGCDASAACRERAAYNAAHLKAPGSGLGAHAPGPRAAASRFGSSRGCRQGRVADRLGTADRPVRARPAGGEPDHRAARRAARREQANSQREQLPADVLVGPGAH